MAQARIVVVDDDMDTLEFMGLLLRTAGYAVTLCSRHDAALTCIRDSRPDLVVLDMCQGCTVVGWQILEQMRSDPTTAHIAAIMYSADPDALQAGRAGLQRLDCDILPKPFLPPQLFNKMERALRMAPHA